MNGSKKVLFKIKNINWIHKIILITCKNIKNNLQMINFKIVNKLLLFLYQKLKKNKIKMIVINHI